MCHGEKLIFTWQGYLITRCSRLIFKNRYPCNKNKGRTDKGKEGTPTRKPHWSFDFKLPPFDENICIV